MKMKTGTSEDIGNIRVMATEDMAVITMVTDMAVITMVTARSLF